MRVFPLSNWTELDVWQYIAIEDIPLPSLYFAHQRDVFERDGMLYAANPFVKLLPGERIRSADARGGDRRGRRGAGHRARRDPGRRPLHRGGDGRPQARGVLLKRSRRIGRPIAGRMTGRYNGYAL